MSPRLRRKLLALALALALLSPLSALAQEGQKGSITRTPGEVSQVTKEVSNEILSPFCPGKTLEMCPSGGAAEVRRTIQKLAADGHTKQDIKQQILDKYGEEYKVIEPPASDNVGLLILLVVAFILCVVAVIAFASKRSGSADLAGRTGASDTSANDLDGPASRLDDDELSDADAANLAALRDMI